MFFIHKTVSLCNHCYKHIPGIVYENDKEILMAKKCPQHGIMHSVVETDVEFYYGIEHFQEMYEDLKEKLPISNSSVNQILFEASDRCQLECPHCYHLPDNKITDRKIEDIIKQIDGFPKTGIPMLAGAEATLRPDFFDLCKQIDSLGFEQFELLSNGLKFSSADWTKKIFQSGLKSVCVGLNHSSYQGLKVHNKQLRGLNNILEYGVGCGYVGYTIESYEHLPEILNEIRLLANPKIDHFRIRCGSFIGRSSDKERSYLSKMIKYIKNILGDEISISKSDNNPYHIMMNWKGIDLRLIQWPDVTNIDMEELDVGPWCQFYRGPITNFVHQVITRDAYKNMGLPQLDVVPEKYTYKYKPMQYWKDEWFKPIKIKESDLINDVQMWDLKNIGVDLKPSIIPIKKN
jgi:hypothetical protein